MTSEWLLRYLPKKAPPMWLALVWAVASVVVSTILRDLLRPLVGSNIPFITYFPAVLVLSIWGGFFMGTACAVLSLVVVAFTVLGPDPLGPGNAWALGGFAFSSALIIIAGSGMSEALRSEFESEARARAAEEGLRLLVKELGHRSKNGLAVVMAIVSQSAKNSENVQTYERVINSRLGAMARAQDAVLDASGQSAGLVDLLETLVAPFDRARFDFGASNKPIVVSSDLAIGLGLLINELATNATKYGALSNGDGRVRVSWGHEGEGHGRVLWEEQGGPPVGPASAEGFGTRLVPVALQAQGGTAKLTLNPGGAVCRMTFPIEAGEAA